MAVQVRYNFGACRKGVVGDFRRPLSTCECQLRLSPTMVGNTRVVAGRDQQRSTSTSKRTGSDKGVTTQLVCVYACT